MMFLSFMQTKIEGSEKLHRKQNLSRKVLKLSNHACVAVQADVSLMVY